MDVQTLLNPATKTVDVHLHSNLVDEYVRQPTSELRLLPVISTFMTA